MKFMIRYFVLVFFNIGLSWILVFLTSLDIMTLCNPLQCTDNYLVIACQNNYSFGKKNQFTEINVPYVKSRVDDAVNTQ
jgi:hypothetical protein